MSVQFVLELENVGSVSNILMKLSKTLLLEKICCWCQLLPLDTVRSNTNINWRMLCYSPQLMESCGCWITILIILSFVNHLTIVNHPCVLLNSWLPISCRWVAFCSSKYLVLEYCSLAVCALVSSFTYYHKSTRILFTWAVAEIVVGIVCSFFTWRNA